MLRTALRFSVMLAALLFVTSTASADRVLVLEALGNADEDLRRSEFRQTPREAVLPKRRRLAHVSELGVSDWSP